MRFLSFSVSSRFSYLNLQTHFLDVLESPSRCPRRFQLRPATLVSCHLLPRLACPASALDSVGYAGATALPAICFKAGVHASNLVYITSPGGPVYQACFPQFLVRVRDEAAAPRSGCARPICTRVPEPCTLSRVSFAHGFVSTRSPGCSANL